MASPCRPRPEPAPIPRACSRWHPDTRRARRRGRVVTRQTGARRLAATAEIRAPGRHRMTNMRIALIATVAACLLAAAPSSAVPTKTTDGQLVGSVGPDFTISLKDTSGANVTHLAVGTYTLLVHDLSDEHNFHLSGPGVDVSTDVIGN